MRTWPERLATAGDAIWFYLGKLIWPHPLIAIYPRWEIDAGQWFSYLPLLAVIVILSIFWLKREPWSRAWFFAFAYFLVALLPALGLIDNYFSVFPGLRSFPVSGQHGTAGAGGAGMARLADFVIPRKVMAAIGLCAGLLLILGMLSWQRAWVYASEETLWTDTLARNPDAGWVTIISALFFLQGGMDEALPISKCPGDLSQFGTHTATLAGLSFKGGNRTRRCRIPKGHGNQPKPGGPAQSWRCFLSKGTIGRGDYAVPGSAAIETTS